MRIVLVTPLYPPDVAYPAPYIKELATRLSALHHQITVVTYADIPEEIPGIHILSVSKHQPLLYRIIAYTKLLSSATKDADIIYAENGASVELPLVLTSFNSRVPRIVHLSDIHSHTRATKNILYGLIERLALSRAKKIITDSPKEKPEILPFSPFPTEAMESYETSWTAHIKMLTDTFTHDN